MRASATVTSKGQVTIPASIRRRLGIRAGTRLVFWMEEDDVVVQGAEGRDRLHVEPLPDFFDLAGSVAVPADLRGASWESVRAAAWEEQANRRARDASD
jgi:antitoxin PrlF